MMENMVLIWKRADGSISITYPISKQLEKESDAEYVERIKLGSNVRNAEFMGSFDSSTLPIDRKYRDAWLMDSSKNISLDQIKKDSIDSKISKRERLDLIDPSSIKDINDAKTVISDLIDFIREK